MCVCVANCKAMQNILRLYKNKDMYSDVQKFWADVERMLQSKNAFINRSGKLGTQGPMCTTSNVVKDLTTSLVVYNLDNNCQQ